MARLSVLAAFCLAAPAWGQTPELQRRIDHALDQARPALLRHLRAAREPSVRSGQLALLLLAAIHDGVPADDEAFVAGLAALTKARLDQCYDLSLRLLVFEALPRSEERDRIAKRDTAELLRHQSKQGGFHYREKPRDWDLSNTQYAALGLRAAVAMGIEVDRRVFARMAAEVGDQQDNYGGFGYAPGDGAGRMGSYASMTAAGIAVLAICRQMHGPRPPQAIDKRIARGWQWFAKNVRAIGSPSERWCFYFHYGLERAAILCDVETIGETDWYEAGARMFCDLQHANGSWFSQTDAGFARQDGAVPGDPVSTAFAVLFLRRKFQKEVGPITAHVVALVNLGPHSKDADVAACAEQLAARGKAAMPELLAALRSEIGPQRRAAAQALAAIAGEAFGYDPAKDAEQNRDAVRAAELWYLRNR